MRLRIDFGTYGTRKEVAWWQPLEDFPKLLSLNGKPYEWFMYDKDASGQVDWILLYTEIPPHTPYYHEAVAWESLFGHRQSSCECGAIYSSFPWDHMRYCRLWSKW